MRSKIFKILAVVAVAAALAGVGVAVAHQGVKYQNKKHAAQVAKDQKVTNLETALKTEQAKTAKFSAGYDHMRLECEKGRGAYDALTTLSKTKAAATAAPVCGPAVLQ